jgi:hypothetical protein
MESNEKSSNKPGVNQTMSNLHALDIRSIKPLASGAEPV